MEQDGVSRLAADFAKANKDEQQFLRDENRDLKQLIVAMLRSQGGQVRLPLRDLHLAKDVRFETKDDRDNRVFVVRVVPEDVPENTTIEARVYDSPC